MLQKGKHFTATKLVEKMQHGRNASFINNCPSLPLCCYDKTMIQTNFEEEGFIWFTCNVTEENRAGTQEGTGDSIEMLLLTDLLSMLLFLFNSGLPAQICNHLYRTKLYFLNH